MYARYNSGQKWGAKGLVWAPANGIGLNMPLVRVSLGFTELSDPELDDFATKVAAKILENAGTFGTLPVTPAQITTAQTAFHVSLSSAKGAGKAATADKNAKRAILEGLLRQDALAIQAKPGLTESDVDLSGYDPIVSGSHAPVAVSVPVILDVSNEASTKLRVKLQAPPGYKTLEVRGSVGTNAPVLLATFTNTRDTVVEALVSGSTYTLQARAGFGNNRFSEWSEPVTHMCT